MHCKMYKTIIIIEKTNNCVFSFLRKKNNKKQNSLCHKKKKKKKRKFCRQGKLAIEGNTRRKIMKIDWREEKKLNIKCHFQENYERLKEVFFHKTYEHKKSLNLSNLYSTKGLVLQLSKILSQFFLLFLTRKELTIDKKFYKSNGRK